MHRSAPHLGLEHGSWLTPHPQTPASAPPRKPLLLFPSPHPWLLAPIFFLLLPHLNNHPFPSQLSTFVAIELFKKTSSKKKHPTSQPSHSVE